MKNSLAIDISGISKVYRLYQHPIDRMKEALHPLRKKYHQEFHALNNISCQIYRGETVGIIGKNGAGKSTLLKIITGVLTPTSGTVSVQGRISSLLELGTGFNPELNGIENAFFNGLLLGHSKEEMESKIDSIIRFADIGEFIHQPVKIYSSGMFSRLAFSVAFHVDPDILIIDEALSVGDMSFQKKCFEKFHSIRERGATILFVSHDPFQVKGYCERALYLKNGELVSFGKSHDVVDQYIYDQEKLIIEKNNDQENRVLENELEEVSNASQHLIRIEDVRLLNSNSSPINEFYSGDEVNLEFTYRTFGSFPDGISFVFNLYRHDDLYICGATSVMDQLSAFKAENFGIVRIRFPSLPLLAGKYKWRVAINDSQGLGIYTEALPVCECTVKDSFESVGLVHIERIWYASKA